MAVNSSSGRSSPPGSSRRPGRSTWSRRRWRIWPGSSACTPASATTTRSAGSSFAAAAVAVSTCAGSGAGTDGLRLLTRTPRAGLAKISRSAFKMPNRPRSVLASWGRDRPGRPASQAVMSSRVTCRNVEYRPPASARKVRMLEMSRTIVLRLRGLRRGPPCRSRPSQVVQLGADLGRQPGELLIQPDGQRVGPVVVQHAGSSQHVDDVRERHVPGGQLPDRAGPDRLAGTVDGHQDPQAALGQGQRAR